MPNAPVSVETREGNWEGEWGQVGRPKTKAEMWARPLGSHRPKPVLVGAVF